MEKDKSKKLTWGILSVYRSQIMGAAIIWIMLLHGVELYPQILKELLVIGFVMDRVLIPYLLISLPFWIWLDLWVKKEIGAFLQDIGFISFWKSGTYTVCHE